MYSVIRESAKYNSYVSTGAKQYQLYPTGDAD